MALDSVHPQYAAMKPEWDHLRDFAKGERAVKRKREVYLPATQGMNIDGMKVGELGRKAYDAYLLRAVFPEHLSDALEIFMGMLHNKSAVIELPKEMEPLRDSATELGEPLEVLLQRINREQLTTGRVGILADMPENPDPTNPMPFIALYVAEAIINWDDGDEADDRAALNLVVLNESGYKRDDDFGWTEVTKYRVLQLGTFADNEQDNTGFVYKQGAFSNEGVGSANFDESKMLTPMFRGKTLEQIPFAFINSNDISPKPNEPPLISLARLCGAIYRGEADYRQNLFMQGQDTLVVIGERRSSGLDPAGAEEPLRTGAGARIDLDLQGDAKYVGVSAAGLSEQRTSLENDYKRADSRSGQLIDASRGDKESGSALRTRIGASTSTLNQIAKTGGLALEMLLKSIARWMNADPSAVKVTPNLEFADYQMSGQDLVNLMTGKRAGAPLSDESIHRLMVQGNLTSYDYVTEAAKVKADPPPPIDPNKVPANPGDPAPKDPSNPAPNND